MEIHSLTDKILIVDDSKSIRYEMRRILEKHAFTVFEAENGKDGIEKLKKNSDVKLVISDLNMPEMDGLTMCEEIRQQSEFDHLPIFILTSETNSDLKARGKKAGILAWITKPIVEDRIVSAIKKVLSNG